MPDLGFPQRQLLLAAQVQRHVLGVVPQRLWRRPPQRARQRRGEAGPRSPRLLHPPGGGVQGKGPGRGLFGAQGLGWSRGNCPQPRTDTPGGARGCRPFPGQRPGRAAGEVDGAAVKDKWKETAIAAAGSLREGR